ncbi:MAG: UDP-2,4-diacetamido-2,4,6-trideoxy-beta-L-altropyranose hydrolase [Methanothrix sp.]|nr:MAG: UDP-2,4-diacetamido-2,4,6-trideoxy-beta-L-altropyranose hydrolase [Methanothrix sp.]
MRADWSHPLDGQMSASLIVRADASTEIGTGHVMRCLALAQGWQDAGGIVSFVMGTHSHSLESRLKSEGMEIIHLTSLPGGLEDAGQTAKVARERRASWIVIDGYHFHSEYQEAIKSAGLDLLAIDDNGHAIHYFADLVLNQNLHADSVLYQSREPGTRLLLGTRYVQLRREFRKLQGLHRRVREDGKRILVTLGGSDPENVTLKVLCALQRLSIPEIEAVIVVGGNNPNYEHLQASIADFSPHFRLAKNVEDMPELLSWADIAVTSAGTTVWEAAFMGLPSILLTIADNQIGVAKRLGEMDMAINLGWHQSLTKEDIARAVEGLLSDPGKRGLMSRRVQELVDGEGVERVQMYLSGCSLRLRRARQADCERIWRWANEPETRAASFSSDAIPWENHVEWFNCKINDPNYFLFIAQDVHDDFVGVVRFQACREEAVISVNITENKRGLGLGMPLIVAAVEELFRTTCITSVHAFIKPENDRSIRTFEGCKFQRMGTKSVNGENALHYLKLKCPELQIG